MPIQTTQDLFWLLFGFSIILLTIFLCWALYYLIVTIRDVRNIVKDTKNKIDLVEEFIITTKEKLSDSSKYLKSIVDTAIKVTAWLATKNTDNKNSKK